MKTKARSDVLVRHFEIHFQRICFSIPDIRPVEEGTEEEEGKNREDPGGILASLLENVQDENT